MNIKEKFKKINSENINNAIIVLIVLFVGLVSFGLGRLSALSERKAPVTAVLSEAELPTASVGSSASLRQGEKLFVASKSGTKYHYPWCSGAQRIKNENKLWFSTREEAEKEGYSPASNCKGL